MSQKESITNLQPLPVVRVIHLKDMVFLVGYMDSTIEMRDLTNAKLTGKDPEAPILSFSTEEQSNGEI